MISKNVFRLLAATWLAWASAAVAQQKGRELPAPTGTLAVGRVTYFWTDESRGEPNTPDERDKRELRVDVWYPAEASPSAQVAPYFPEMKTLGKTLGPESILIGAIKAHTLDAPAAAGGTKRFPALVFSPGMGTNGTQYAFIVEELVSHGYLVATVDHPFHSRAIAYPDGRVVTPIQETRSTTPEEASANYRARVEPRAADLRFVLDCLGRLDAGQLDTRFAGRIDLARAGVLGHSIGGVTAAEASMSDARFKAALNMDGHASSLPFLPRADGRGPRQPLIELTDKSSPPSDQQLAKFGVTREQFDRQSAAAAARANEAMRTIAGGSCRITIPDLRHGSFADMAIYDPGTLEERYRRMQIIRDYVRAFFDKHLCGRSDTILDSSSSPYAGVAVERFSPVE